MIYASEYVRAAFCCAEMRSQVCFTTFVGNDILTTQRAHESRLIKSPVTMGKGSKTSTKKQAKAHKKGADGKNKEDGRKTTVMAQEKAGTMKIFLNVATTVLKEAIGSIMGLEEKVDEKKMNPSQDRGFADLLEDDLSKFAKVVDESQAFISRSRMRGKPPVKRVYKPNPNFPAVPPGLHKTFKDAYKKKHPEAKKEEVDEAWKKAKDSPDAMYELEMKVRVAKWQAKKREWELATKGKADTHIFEEVTLHPPPRNPVKTRKSDKILENLIKKKDEDISEEKLQKMVKKAAKREKSRYEKDLARAAKIAHMDVDELRGGSS